MARVPRAPPPAIFTSVTVRIDLFRLHAEEYASGRSPRIVTVGPARFLSVAGHGEPEGAAFDERVAGIHELAGALRAATRRARGKDFRVPPLEVLCWEDSPEPEAAPDGPRWKLLLRMPNFVRRGDLALAVAALPAEASRDLAASVRLEDLKEGRCVQALHLGARAEQPTTLDRMRRAAAELGLAFHGRHHEVHLSDPSRVPPERRRTLLRRPVRAR